MMTMKGHGLFRAATRLSWLVVTGVAVGACSAPPMREGFVSCQWLGRPAACVSVPLAEEDADIDAKRFSSPVNGKARVYLLRPYTHEPRVTSPVLMDQRLVADLGPLTYLVMDVSPGKHQIRVQAPGAGAVIDVDLKPAEVYYIQHQFDQAFGTVTARLTFVDAADAQPRIRKSKRAAMPAPE